MKLYVNKKLLTNFPEYFICDKAMQTKYSFICKGKQILIYNQDNEKIAYIKQNKVYINDIYQYEINDKYTLSNKYIVSGSFESLIFNIKDADRNIIAKINAKNIGVGEKYQLEIYTMKDITTVITIIIAIICDLESRDDI